MVLLAFSSPTSQPPVSTLSTHFCLFLSLSLFPSLSHSSLPPSPSLSFSLSLLPSQPPPCRSLRFNPSTSLPLPSFVAVRPTRAPTTSVAFHRRHRLAALPFPTLNLAVDEPTTPLASYVLGSPARLLRKRNLHAVQLNSSFDCPLFCLFFFLLLPSFLSLFTVSRYFLFSKRPTRYLPMRHNEIDDKGIAMN